MIWHQFLSRREPVRNSEAAPHQATIRFRIRLFVTQHNRVFILLAVVALIICRAPFLLVAPRIWAEEGRFLSYALNHSVGKALLYTNWDSGYYLLSADVPAILSALVSKWFGLQYAPFLSTYFSLFVQLIPFAILIFGKSHVFSTPLRILAGCTLILFAPTTYGMIWLNTINSLSWTGIACLVLVFEDTSGWSRRKKYSMRALLVLLGLCGPYGPIMFPLFLLAALLYREREHLIQSMLLACCTAIQSVVYVFTRHAGGADTRFVHMRLDSAIVNSFYFFVLNAIFGQAGADKVCAYLGMSESLQRSLSISNKQATTLAAYFSGLLLLLFLSSLWTKQLRSQNTLILVSFLYLATFTAATAAFGIPGDRYMFIPGFSFLLLLLTSAWSDRRVLARVACSIALFCSLWVGLRDYTTYWRGFAITSPPWAAEVQHWRRDPTYQPRVWPDWPGVFRWNPKHRK